MKHLSIRVIVLEFLIIFSNYSLRELTTQPIEFTMDLIKIMPVIMNYY